MPRSQLLALICCTTALCGGVSTRALASEPDDERGLPQRDDPKRRAEALRRQDGDRTPEERIHLLEEAHREAVREEARLESARALRANAAVAGQVWINLGPTSAAYESNGVQYSEVDSGRVRKIVPHPLDANIVYLATAGGGVWKSFDALKPVTSTTGPHWTPITETVGSLSVGALALDPRNPETLVLGLGDPFDVQTPGLVTSDDGGAHWSAPVSLQGSYGGGGVQTATSVRDLAFDGGTGTVFAATDVGLFRGPTGGIGAGWTLVDLTPTHTSLGCWSVVWVGGGVWLATCQDGGENGKLFRSTDGGHGWAEVTSLPDPNGSKMPGRGRMALAAAAGDSANPSGARVYLLAAGLNQAHASIGTYWDQKDVYKSTNGGASWSSLGMYDDATSPIGSVATKPRNPNADQSDCDVLHDQAWYNQAIQVDPRDGNRVFIGGNLSLIRTQDGGANWDIISNWLPRSPTISNQYNLPYIHADFHAMAVSTAGLLARLYVGTDGGLFASDDQPLATSCPNSQGFYIYCSAFTGPPGYSGTTVPPGSAKTGMPSPSFTSKMNRGITSHLAYSIAADENDATNQVLMGGLQDNGTRLRAQLASDTTPTVFNQVIGGDGFGVAIGRSVDTTSAMPCYGKTGSLLIGTVYTMIWRSTDCGSNFGPAVKGIGACTKQPSSIDLATSGGNPCQLDYGSNFFMKMATDWSDSTGKTFLTLINAGGGAGDVYRTQDSAATWVKINGSIKLAGGSTATQFPGQLYYIGAHPRTAGSYLTVTYSRVYVTLDGGANWTESASPPRSRLSSAAFDPSDSTRKTIWATSRSTSLGLGAHVFVSTDGGATWTAKPGSGAGALPDVPANAVKVDSNDPQTIYLGTEIGLYRSQDGGGTWSRYGRGLPLVSVTEISVGAASTFLRVSTFGRGFWEINPRTDVPAGPLGNGDMDRNQILDAFDVVLQAAGLWSTTADPLYDAQGNLVGTNNLIDGSDVDALVARLGGRP
jgi:hypothetical protein